MADNEPGLFRCKMPSGAEMWGPGRLTRAQRTMIKTASRPVTTMPNGDLRRFFDIECLADELLVQFACGQEAGWTVKTSYGELERTREAIESVSDPDTDADLTYGSIMLLRHFYPEYFRPLPGSPAADSATEGEGDGATTSAPATPTPEKDGSVS